MRKKVDQRIRTLVENGVKLNERLALEWHARAQHAVS